MSKNILEMNLIERASYVNELLKKEGDLKKVAQSLGIKYSSFCKEMRTGGYSYNQSKKQYEKTLTLDEYIKIRDYEKETSEKEDAINFLTSHLTEIKEILYVYSENLILDSKVYQPNIPTTVFRK
jgi:phage antirepressor YoqD-like protein